MAVIKNQKTGMWEVRTYYKDWTGTRRQKTKRDFAKKSEAQEWERAFKLKDEMNINMKFKDFAELYLSDIQPRIKYNSFLTEKHIIETKILPYFGHRKLNEIRPADVIQWQNEIMKLKKDNGEAYSPMYLKNIHNQLSAILNHAVNMYDLKDNVARKAGSMGKEESKEIMFWTQEEYQAFIEQVADKPISYHAFEILYWTGIREGELLALTPNDFDFTKKTLRINKSYQRLEGKDVITDPKTPKSNRVIVMPDFLAVEIEDFISRLDGISNDDRIFTISKSYLHHEMDRGAKLAGVKRIKIHGLRHEILQEDKYSGDNGAEEIENTIQILQNIVSFNIPLLLKPLFDIKNPESIFLTCMQAGCIQEETRIMTELGIPRETALYLYEKYFKKNAKINRSDEELEKDIRTRLSECYEELPIWVKCQLDFLV